MREHDPQTAPRLPWSQEAEQAVLGALMLDPDAAFRIADRRLQPAHFFAHPHRLIWSAIASMVAKRHAVDVLTVFDHLRAHGHAEECGGLAYLNAIAQSVPSAASIGMYAGIVLDRAVCRRISEAADVAHGIASAPGDADEKLDQVASLFAGIQRTQVRPEPRSVADLVAERQRHWEALEAGETLPGMPTHLPTLDQALGGGLKRGKVGVIAARPSVGKTSFALQLATAVAADGHPVLLLSQEMQSGELVDRFVANQGRVKLGALSVGRFDRDDWTRIASASDAATQLPLYIDDQPALTLLDIRAKARRAQQRHGLAVVVVDYLQLCSPGAGRQDHRHHQIEAISRGLKQLAKELDVCVLVLSQINRQSANRPDGEPTLGDLKESGAIEEDADFVVMLHPKGNLPDGAMLVAAILAKNRQGRRGRISLAFDGGTQHWSESTASVSKVGDA